MIKSHITINVHVSVCFFLVDMLPMPLNNHSIQVNIISTDSKTNVCFDLKSQPNIHWTLNWTFRFGLISIIYYFIWIWRTQCNLYWGSSLTASNHRLIFEFLFPKYNIWFWSKHIASTMEQMLWLMTIEIRNDVKTSQINLDYIEMIDLYAFIGTMGNPPNKWTGSIRKNRF